MDMPCDACGTALNSTRDQEHLSMIHTTSEPVDTSYGRTRAWMREYKHFCNLACLYRWLGNKLRDTSDR